jgi:hypothetical protein
MSEDTAWLAALGIDEEEDDAGEEVQEEVEAQYSKPDEKARRATKAVGEVLAKHLKEEEAEKIYNSFMAEASDTAKEIYAVLAEDDMTPSQMKKVVDAAQRKAAAIDEKLNPQAAGSSDESSEDAENVVDEKARKMAAEQWGTSPIHGSGDVPTKADELEARAKKGDQHASFLLFQDLVPKP